MDFYFLLVLAQRTVKEFLEDDCMHMAAGIAYYALFSIFPLLLGLVALFGVVLEPIEVQDRLARAVEAYVPASTDLVSQNLRAVVQGRETVGVLALLGLFWSASALFAAVRRSINRAWDVEKERPFLRQKLLELSMIGGVGLLFLLSLASTAVFRALLELRLQLEQWKGLAGLGPLEGMVALLAAGTYPLVRAAMAMLPFLFTFGVFTAMYRLLPNARVRWR